MEPLKKLSNTYASYEPLDISLSIPLIASPARQIRSCEDNLYKIDITYIDLVHIWLLTFRQETQYNDPSNSWEYLKENVDSSKGGTGTFRIVSPHSDYIETYYIDNVIFHEVHRHYYYSLSFLLGENIALVETKLSTRFSNWTDGEI